MRKDWAGSRMAALAMLIAIPVFQGWGSTIDYVTVSSQQYFGGNANTYDSITGLSQHLGNGVTATFTSTPSTDITGLTAASVSTTAQFGSPDVATSISSASANLATGILGIYATGNCTLPNVNCNGEAFASAEMRDLLTFTNTTGTVQDIEVSFAFDGTVALGGLADRNVQNVDLCFIAGTFQCLGTSEEFTYTDGSISGPTPPTLTVPTSGWVSTSILPGANGYSDTFLGTFAVPAGVSSATMSAFMKVDCGVDGTTCDFSHTGQLSIAQPAGVSFTSQSGVLLTQSVPEPATFGFAALALLAGALRKRRQ